MELKSLGFTLALALSAMLAQACGGVAFTRADGARKYKPLKMNSVVKVVDSPAALGGAHEVIGTLEVTHKAESADATRDSVVTQLSRTARRRGCDAIVGLSTSTSTGKSIRREKIKGPQGKVTYKKVTVAVKEITWSGTCVRTASARGGLKGTDRAANKQVARAEGAKPAPASPTPPAATEKTTGEGGTDTPPPPKTTAKATVGGPTAPKVPPTGLSPPKIPPPPSMPTLTDQAKALWKALGGLQDVYLPARKGHFDVDPTSTFQALEALAKVMSMVAGKKGFWRHTVPSKWFGCGSNAKSDACTRLAKANTKVEPFATMGSSIKELTVQSASAWLSTNHPRVQEFLRDYVPTTRDLTGMKETPFFKQHFAL